MFVYAWKFLSQSPDSSKAHLQVLGEGTHEKEDQHEHYTGVVLHSSYFENFMLKRVISPPGGWKLDASPSII